MFVIKLAPLDNDEFYIRFDSYVKNLRDPLFPNFLQHVFLNAQKSDEFEFNGKQLKEDLEAFTNEMSNEFLEDIIPIEKQKLPEFRSDQDHLKLKIRDIWGESLDLLRILFLMSYEVGSNFNHEEQKNPEINQDYVFIALTHLHGKACQTFFEIITLLENGFASGANARWRTLEEIAVISYFIKKHGQEIAERYLNHSFIDSRKSMEKHNEHADRLGLEKYSDEDIRKIQEKCSELEIKYGPNYSEDYGWAAPCFPSKNGRKSARINYSMLEKDVNLDNLRPYYKMASHAVHAHSKGILFNISYHPTENVIPSGSSIFGLADPGQLAAISMVQINSILLTSKPTVTRLVFLKGMEKLLAEIKTSFSSNHMRLEESRN